MAIAKTSPGVFDVEHIENHMEGSPIRKIYTFKLVVAISSLALSFVVSLAVYLTAVTIISEINADIGPNASNAWIASGYTVSYAVISVLYGSLADSFGRRWFAISAGFFVGLGSLVAALAQNVNTVIAGMVLMGFGGAGGIQCISAISEIIPTKARGPIVGLIEAPFLAFTIGGSFYAHRMADYTGPGWRSVYWMGTASGFFFAFLVFLTYKPQRALATKDQTTEQILKDFDYLGFMGIAAGLTLFLMGIIWEPQYGPSSAQFLAPLIVGFCLIVATGFQQVYFARRPIMHPKLWKRFRTFTLQSIVIFVSGMLFYSLQALYPLFMTLAFDGDDAIQVGIDGFPLGIATVGGVMGGVLLPFLARRIGTNWVLVIGMIECTLFIALMALVDIDSKPMAMGFAAAATFGIGWTNLLSIPLIQLCSPNEWIGFATGLRTFMSLSGGSVSTSIYITIFSNRSTQLVPVRVSAAAIAAGLPAGSVAQLLGVLTGALPLSTAIPGATARILEISALELRRAYIASFRYVWYSSIPFGVVAILAAAFTEDLTPVMTAKIAQGLENDKPMQKQSFSELEKDLDQDGKLSVKI